MMTTTEIKPDWRIVKIDWTGLCGEWVEEHGVKSATIYYLTDFNWHVHLCELTPSLELEPILAQVEFKDEGNLSEAQQEKRQDLEDELLRSEEGCTYMWASSLEKEVSRPLLTVFTMPEREEDEDAETYRARCVDEAREYLVGNQHWPF